MILREDAIASLPRDDNIREIRQPLAAARQPRYGGVLTVAAWWFARSSEKHPLTRRQGMVLVEGAARARGVCCSDRAGVDG
jgi:hypothetical protein